LLWLTAADSLPRTLASGILRLAEAPELQDRLIAEPQRLTTFLEEVFRLDPPEHSLPRIATADIVIAGVEIPRGSVVHLCVGAANRDPGQFDAPTEVRFDRPGRRHLSFGYGIHHCLGVQLARGVLPIALEALLSRGRLALRDPRYAVPFEANPYALAAKRVEVVLGSASSSAAASAGACVS
jgi:hypothetical protein